MLLYHNSQDARYLGSCGVLSMHVLDFHVKLRPELALGSLQPFCLGRSGTTRAITWASTFPSTKRHRTTYQTATADPPSDCLSLMEIWKLGYISEVRPVCNPLTL